MSFILKNICFRYPRHFALTDISLDFSEPVTALIGPNGAGKSTLIHCMAHVCSCHGTMSYRGQAVDLSRHDFFRSHVGYLPQAARTESSLTVFETVLLGLMNHLSMRIKPQQIETVECMLERLELSSLATRPLCELSGGQQQTVLLAQALVKEPRILLLDEPLNNLDVYRQFALMNLIAAISSSRDMLTIVVLHDIPIAARYANRIAVLQQGRLYDYGSPDKVITERMMREVYRMETSVHPGTGGYPIIEYRGQASNELVPL